MMKDRKVRLQELQSELQRSTSIEAAMVKELLALQLDEAKDSLLSHTGDDLIRAQGGAQAVNKLLLGVTRPAPAMQQRREQV